MSFNTEPKSAGRKILCPSCGKMNVVPQVQVKAGPPPIAAVVTPIDDEEEDDIPEIDVEVHGPADDKKNVIDEDSKALGSYDFSDGENVDPSGFAARNAAAGANRWDMIGAIKLTEFAECAAYDAGAAYGLVGQEDDVLVLNMKKGKKLDRFGGHDGVVTRVAMSPQGDVAVSGDIEGDVVSWEVDTRKRRRRFQEHESPITALTISRDGEFVASGDRDGAVRLWHLSSGFETVLSHADWGERITALTFSSDGSRLLAGSNKGRVVVWSLKNGDVIQRLRLAQQNVSSLQFSAGADTILAAVAPGDALMPVHAKVWRMDVLSGDMNECFKPADVPRSLLYYTTLDHGGKRLLCVGKVEAANVLEIWSLSTGQRLHAFVDLHGAVACLAVAPNNMRVMAALKKRQLKVFAIPERETVVEEAPRQPGDRRR